MSRFNAKLPGNVADAVAASRAAWIKFQRSPNNELLLAMVISTNHVMDRLLKEAGCRTPPGRHKPIQKQYPEWMALRRAANAIKHEIGDVGAAADIHHVWSLDVPWESPDFWLGPRHLGDLGKVGDVCKRFLDQLDSDLASGKAYQVAAEMP